MVRTISVRQMSSLRVRGKVGWGFQKHPETKKGGLCQQLPSGLTSHACLDVDFLYDLKPPPPSSAAQSSVPPPPQPSIGESEENETTDCENWNDYSGFDE